ncbi:MULTISPECIES: transglycosylase SLT domain-containing protein [unclassified Beijerinckia]|uniref:transglycosylase SLT domain-containing protein n=1 Tax=unclassified Beijerinckia TaxID=2638183 RepID=UPI000ACC4C7D|nr:MULTISPECIES: transglycosylase SLT domain-containing protein [unclassified Beijerinckia]
MQTSAPATAATCEREMLRASQKYKVPLAVLYAVGLTETGKKGSMQPYAMNVDGKAVFSRDMAEAQRKFESFRTSGAKFIDVGCMQINHRFHGKQFRSLAHMFNPSDNVEYAARFLVELKSREQTWTMAVARYNAGPNNNPAQKRYVCAVIANMVVSGFGTWTPAAKNFCA